MTCIGLAANKSIPRIFIFVRYLYYVFTPCITNITVQHKGCNLPILTDFDLLTNYSSMKLTSFCKLQGMYLLLTQIILPNTYHFEIVLLPNTIP